MNASATSERYKAKTSGQAPEKSPVAEYMKIRRYVINLIANADGNEIQLPTILELSRRFQVSRPTVSRAMKVLTEDGYVIGRPGLGAFINPARRQLASFTNQPKPKVVGLLIGDGMAVHTGSHTARLVGNLLIKLAELPVDIRQFNLTSHNKTAVAREIENEMLDLLIWHNFWPRDDVVAELDIPTLWSGYTATEGRAHCRIDLEGVGHQCGRALLAEGRRHVVYLPAVPGQDFMLAGIRRAYAEAGVELNPKLFLDDPATCFDMLRHIFNFGAPADAVVNGGFPNAAILDLARECHADTRDAYRLVLHDFARGADDFYGYTYEFPFAAHAANVAARVADLLFSAAPAEGVADKAPTLLEFVEKRAGAVVERRPALESRTA